LFIANLILSAFAFGNSVYLFPDTDVCDFFNSGSSTIVTFGCTCGCIGCLVTTGCAVVCVGITSSTCWPIVVGAVPLT
jgi:hypothetical protein